MGSAADMPGRDASGEEILAGVGVHGGRPCRLEIRLRADGPPGPGFRFPGFANTLSIGDLARLPRTARHATVLGPPDRLPPERESVPGSAPSLAAATPVPSARGAFPGSASATVETPEHLLAALLFFSGVPLLLRADAPELPGLDGSALPYREALSRLSPAEAARPAWREYPCDLKWEHRWQDGHISIRPAPGFRVRYQWDRGPLRQCCVIEDAAGAWREILPARTFAFHADWRAATAAGLMAGAGRDSGLLLAGSEPEYRSVLALHPEWKGGPYPLLNQTSWRMPDEPVKHKVLDLLGDLALNGLALPRASIEVRNGGHHAHHLLLTRLSEC